MYGSCETAFGNSIDAIKSETFEWKIPHKIVKHTLSYHVREKTKCMKRQTGFRELCSVENMVNHFNLIQNSWKMPFMIF